jgi:chemotaxis response regulator CheB
MSQHRVRVVVGEGQSMRQGLLRFVLEGDGFEVIGEAATSAELARVLAVHQPDVVVLDDGIGATAVQMAREVTPKTKVILVWPGAVVPIGGDARVEPSEVLRDLGGAVARVMGVPIPTADGFVRPEWVERVRKDPTALREMLAARGGIENRRPSVTELQRRGRRLHPGAAAAAANAATASADDDEAAVVILPVGANAGRPNAGSDEPVIVLPDAVAAAAATPLPSNEARERDRKVGTMALGGAAAAGILVLALVLGGSRIQGHLSAEPPNVPPPVVSTPNGPGDQPGNPGGTQGPGGSPITSPSGGGGGPVLVGDGTSPFSRGQFGTIGGGQAGNGTGGNGGGNGGGTPPMTEMPGRSALHNPHGGPPGHLDEGTTADGPGTHGHAGDPPGHSGEHGRSGQHGRGSEHRNAHASDH